MAIIDQDYSVAFPKLTPSEIECLGGLASLCSFDDGEIVFQAGQRGVSLYVVESGEIAIVDESTEEPKTIVVHGPNEFTGDVSLLTDRPAVVSAYSKGACRAYRVVPANSAPLSRRFPTSATSCWRRFETRRLSSNVPASSVCVSLDASAIRL